MRPSRSYRRDIDGLRAVAVLAVVLHHLRTGLTHGGYVGVDVFFVISGYLITGILVKDLADGRFSLGRFYERRVRRIFPALFAMVFGTALVGLFVLLPNELAVFGQSLVATTLFVSNVFFMSQNGYFDTSEAARPLLHTWSLAVEEQFYLFFPLVLALIYGVFRKRLVLCIAVLAILSFALSVVLVARNADTAFYISPGRAWELLLGSLIALGAFPAVRSRWLAELLGGAGLACLIASVILLDETTPFPGAAALAPTLGAALLIYAGTRQTTAVGRVLSWPAFVFLGLISYSLYLWHWPIIMYARLIVGHDLSKVQKVSVLAACVVAATVSWFFVERPFRKANGVLPWRGLWRASAAVMATVCIVGASISLNQGFPNRFSASVDTLSAFTDYDASDVYRHDLCFLTLGSPRTLNARPCLELDKQRPNVLLLGDSHAADLWYGLSKAYPEIHFLEAAATNCKPFLNDRGAEPCHHVMQSVLRNYIANAKPDAVLISVDWRKPDLEPLIATVASIGSAQRPVFVLGQVPTYQLKLSRLLAMAEIRHDPATVARARVEDMAEVDREFSRALSAARIRYVSLYAIMCPGECISTTGNGVPIQFDESHFTETGSMWVARQLRKRGVLFDAIGGTKALARNLKAT